MSVKFPSNDKMKLIIGITIGDSISTPRPLVEVLSGVVPEKADNAVADAIQCVHYTYGCGFRNERKHRMCEDLFVVTTDNRIIRYRTNKRKTNSVKMMGTYDCRGEYMYIGCVFSSGGLHYAIGNSAREVFNKLLVHRPKSVRIVKISSKYCMPVTKMFGKAYCPDTPENADIDKYLTECSKDQSTFYQECMKYVPCEISSVRPDGVVGVSVWPIGDSLSKNAHMVNDPFWYSQMLKWDKPHFWDHLDYVIYNEGPDKPNAFGTVDEL